MPLLKDVLRCAADAGELIQSVAARANRGVAQKQGGDPVTDADRGSDELLRERLLKLEPAAWLSEETVDNLDRLQQSLVWVVDPMDGTKEFVERIPEYAIAIALVEDGRPILGVIYNPATREAFSAEEGKGAYAGAARLRVADGQTLLTSRSEIRAGEFDQFPDWQLVPTGSIAFKLALVASGRAAVTLSRGPKWEWDVCAGSLIVREAGGHVSDVYGEDFRFNQQFPRVRGVVAGFPSAAERALRRVKEIGVSDRMAELG